MATRVTVLRKNGGSAGLKRKKMTEQSWRRRTCADQFLSGLFGGGRVARCLASIVHSSIGDRQEARAEDCRASNGWHRGVKVHRRRWRNHYPRPENDR